VRVPAAEHLDPLAEPLGMEGAIGAEVEGPDVRRAGLGHRRQAHRGHPILRLGVVVDAAGQRRRVDPRRPLRHDRAGPREGLHEREPALVGVAEQGDDVGVLHEGGRGLRDPARVVFAHGQVALGHEVVAHEVLDQRPRVQRDDDARDPHVRRHPGHALDDPAHLHRLGRDRQLRDDGLPGPAGREPLECRDDVLADRAAGARVLDVDLHPLDQARDVRYGPHQHLPGGVDRVLDGQYGRQVPLQRDRRRDHRRRGHARDKHDGRAVLGRADPPHPCLAFIRGFFLLITKTRPRRRTICAPGIFFSARNELRTFMRWSLPFGISC
jgi:hypothetical protein